MKVLVIAAGTALVLAGCGYASGAVGAAHPPSGHPTTSQPGVSPNGTRPGAKPTPAVVAVTHSPSNKMIAEADAARLMTLVKLPPGATKLTATVPKQAPKLLDVPATEPATSTIAVVTRWSVIPGSPADVLAWLASHAPAGSVKDMSGTSGGPEVYETSEGFVWASRPHIDQRGLIVGAMGFAGKTIARFDSQVVYTPNRPVTEQVPAGVDRVEVVATLDPGKQRTYEVTKPAAIALLESTLAGLSRPDFTENPGGPCLCGPAQYEQLTLAFFVGVAKTPAVSVGDALLLAEMGTGNVTVQVGHTAEPILEDGAWSLATAVEHVTGVHFVGIPKERSAP